MQYGLICFAAGLIVFTIGALISMAWNPRALNDVGRAMLDPVRKEIPDSAQTIFNRMLLNDPKAKWLTRSGLALGLIGMGILYFTTNETANSAAPKPVDVKIEIKK